jgi:FkbM family methyltransferase
MRLSPIQKVQAALLAFKYRNDIKQLLIRRYWQRNKTFEITVNGKAVRFDSGDFLSNILFWHGDHPYGFSLEPSVCDMLEKLVPHSKVYADVGGNAGTYSILPAVINPNCKVFYFELDQTMKPLVVRNMALNNISDDRITIVNGAIGNGGDPVEYEPHVFSFLGKFTNENIWNYDCKFRAEQIILDEYFAKKGIAPDLLKIDVDGHETAVLRGMRQILSQTKPHMLLEVHPPLIQQYGSSAAETCGILKGHGYRLFQIENFRADSPTRLKEIQDFSGLADNEMVFCSHRPPSYL